MRRFRPTESFIVWSVIELAVMGSAARLMLYLLDITAVDQVGRGISSATILLSVTVAIVIQLWVKLNDLSALASLSVDERARLWVEVRYRVRALVYLVIFFIAFIFFVLGVGVIASAEVAKARYLLTGVGAGFGACLTLIAAVLVDLNEVASFRWSVEAGDQSAKRAAQVVDELRKSEPGFESDENIQGYKRITGG